MKDNPTPHAGEPPEAQARSNPSNRILVVDDDDNIRLLSAQVLGHTGYRVDTAEDGAAGWEALRANSYDLLITDNNMPKISGIELVKKLRAARMALPVIMASGALPMEEFTSSPWFQRTATLLKPYSAAELLGMVENVLRLNGSNADCTENRLPMIAESREPDRIAAMMVPRLPSGGLWSARSSGL